MGCKHKGSHRSVSCHADRWATWTLCSLFTFHLVAIFFLIYLIFSLMSFLKHWFGIQRFKYFNGYKKREEEVGICKVSANSCEVALQYFLKYKAKQMKNINIHDWKQFNASRAGCYSDSSRIWTVFQIYFAWKFF